MILDFPMRTASVANTSEHWAARAKRTKQQRTVVAFEWLAKRGEAPTLPVTVTFTRLGPKILDDDNNQSAFKAVRDEVAKQLGIDDADTRVTWKYKQSQSKQYRIRIEIDGIAS